MTHPRFSLLLLFVLPLLLVACNGGGGDSDTTDDDDDTIIPTDGDTDDDDDDDQTPSRTLRVEPSPLDFGNVTIGETATKTLTLYNEGTEALTLSGVLLNDTYFALDTPITSAVDIAVGSSYALTFSFTPNNQEPKSATVVIQNNSLNASRQEVTLTGVGVPPAALASIGSDKASVEFGEIPVGSIPPAVRVRVSNNGETGSVLYITSIRILNDGEGNPFTMELDNVPSEEAPIEIERIDPGTGSTVSIPITLHFSPTALGEYTDSIVVDYYTSTEELIQDYEIPLTGTATWGALSVTPFPINFGEVPVNETGEISIRLRNETANDSVTISMINLDLDNWEDIFEFTGETNNITLPAGQSHDLTLSFTPDESDSILTYLIIRTNVSQQTTLRFPVLAVGSDANIPPVARAAQEAHGADINDTMTVSVGSSLTLYGDISYDVEDHANPLTYAWSLTKPGNSSAGFIPDAQSAIVTLGLDVAGFYMVTLVVTDEEGADSLPKIITINVEGADQMVMYDMHYTGATGSTNVNLSLTLPNGTQCNETIAAGGICAVPDGQGAIMIQATGAAQFGTNEVITHAAPANGTFQFAVKLIESCPGTPIVGIDCPFGLGLESPGVTINMYIDDMTTPAHTVTTTLEDEGDEVRWRTTNSSGSWSEPTLVE